MIPELTIDLSELATADAIKTYEQSGCLKITNFIVPEKAAALGGPTRAALETADTTQKALLVGTGRRMVPLPITGPFDDAAIFAPTELREFLAAVHDDKFVLSCFTCVNAQPGAEDQHIHRDYEGLFADKVDTFCPSFAINLFIPLVPFNATNGTTRVWPGSHRKPDTNVEAMTDGFIDPEVAVGEALLVDYRLRHHGTANHSAADRPALCLGYSRNWFLDNRHFNDLNPLQIDTEALDSRSEFEQQLFSRAKMYLHMGPR